MYALPLALILGLVLPQETLAVSGAWGNLIDGVALVCVYLGYRLTHQRGLIFVALVFLIGFTLSQSSIHTRSADTLSPQYDGVPLWLEAEIVELPTLTAHGSRLLLEQVHGHAISGIPTRVWVHSDARHWQAGSHGFFEVVLKPIHGLKNFYGFDSEAWARTLGVGAQGQLRAVRSLSTEPQSIQAGIAALRDHLRAQFNATLADHPARPILIALSVGDQSEVRAEDWTTLWRTGVGHLISISGVHVTLFAEALRRISEWLWRKSARLCQTMPAARVGRLAGLLGALAYALIAGFSIPTQRTFFMQVALTVSEFIGRAWDGPMIWLLALACTLLLDPWAIHSPSLWLSFGAVGSLILSDWGFFGSRGYWASEWHAQWVVNLALLPMICLWFQQLSVISPLANLIAIPWVGYWVTPLTLLSMLPGLHSLCLIAAPSMSLLMTLLQTLAAPSWAALSLPAPPFETGVIAAVAILILLTPIHWPLKPWTLLACLPLIVPKSSAPPKEEARIEVIDVGQGLAVSIQTTHHALVFDTGPRVREWDAGSKIIVPLLKAEGIEALDKIVLSHPDLDHVGGYDALHAAFPDARTEAGFIKEGSVPCLRGDSWQWDGVDFQYLYPPDPPSPLSKNSHNRNNHACVLSIRVGEHRVLIPADIEADAEALLSPTLAPVDVVIAPHHGSHTSSTAAFVQALKPHAVVISCGFRNHFHHPHQEVVDRWESQGASIWRSDLWGAIRMELRIDGVDITPARSQEYSLVRH